jgi:chromate reductase
MVMMVKIGFIVGSLRQNSFQKDGLQSGSFVPSEYEIEYLNFSNLPLYSEDYDGKEPQVYLDFRKLSNVKMLLFYNS